MNKNRKLSITERLIKTGLEVGKIQKDKIGNGLKFRIVSHDVVTESIQKSLFSNGVGVIPTQKLITVGTDVYIDISIKFVCSDNQKEFIDTNCILGIKNKTDFRDFGGSFSYGVKYLLLKTLMLPTGDIDMEYKRAKEDKEEAAEKNPIPKFDVARPISKFEVARIAQDFNTYKVDVDKILKSLALTKIEEIKVGDLDRVNLHISRMKEKVQNLGVANG